MKTLQEKLQDTLAKMEALNQTAIDESRDFSAEEQEGYAALEAEATILQGQIERAAKLNAAKASAQIPAQTVASQQPIYHAPADPAKKEFESVGEFLTAVAFNPNDQRLASQYQEFAPQTDGSMGEGGKGGFAIPKQFSTAIYALRPQDNTIRSRATVIPAGSPPDAEFTMPALNQGAGSNMYGGVAVNWTAEGAAIPPSDINLREISWKPQELTGLYTTTQKSLRNWSAQSAMIEKQFRNALLGAEDFAFYRGTGVGKPLGIVNAPATIKVNRAVANQLGYADLVKMEAKIRLSDAMLFGFIINPALIEWLRNLRNPTSGGGDGALIFGSGDASKDIPPTLLGREIIWNERASAVGSLGDIALVDLKQYYIKDGSGPFVASDNGLSGSNFTTNRVSFKIISNVDGRPALDAPYTLENNQQVSPFVVLDVPA